jgi:osmotically-inducible protein OsmY
MDSHRKTLYVPALCLAMLAVIATSSAGLLEGCSSVEPARFRTDDSTITSQIKAKLANLATDLADQATTTANSDAANPFHIDVTTREGVVTLQGRVKKEEAREKAERYARETDGVQRVIDLVKVGDRT